VTSPVLVVGSIALDDIETPAGSARGVLGGAASYFAIAARYFGPVAAVGVVGSDFPAEHRAFLAERGVDLAGVEAREGKTFRWGGRYNAGLDRRDTLFTELGVFDGWEPRLAPPQREAPFVFLANIHPAIQRRVREQVRAPRFAAMDSMNFWIERTRDELAETLARVHGLVINDEEARQLTGESNLVRAALAIRDLGPGVVIVKRGESGALLFDEAGIFAAPAFPLREVVDPTGAGDSFAGGLMGALAAEGASGPEALRRAVIYGSVMASFCVERFGLARFETLERPEVDRRFADFRALTRF
jgi:sugar/nucleoside kinase (ribokinase family)